MGQEIGQEIGQKIGQENVPENLREDRPALKGLHPYVYAAIAALVFWFVMAIWLSFASDGYTDWLLTVVSGFLLTFVALAFVLSRVTRDDADGNPQQSFRGWASSEFDTWQYRLKAGNAAVEVLLPVAAIALGMTAIGVVLLLVSHGEI